MKASLVSLACVILVASAFGQTSPSIHIKTAGNKLETSWNDPAAVLEEADSPEGPWNPVLEAMSPYQFSPGGTAKFFRLVHGGGSDVVGSLYLLAQLGVVESQIFLPGISVYVRNLDNQQESAPVDTDVNGVFILRSQPSGHYQMCWQSPGFISGCSTQVVTIVGDIVYLAPEEVFLQNNGTNRALLGTISLPDSSPLHEHDAFYGIDLQTTVSLQDNLGATVSTALPNSIGQFVLVNVPLSGTGKAVASCEGPSSQVGVDFAQTDPILIKPPNHQPEISRVFATYNGQEVNRAPAGATVTLTVEAADADGDPLHYLWLPSLSQGSFTSSDSTNVQWTLPAVSGVHIMYARVNDLRGGYATARIKISTTPDFLFGGQVSDSSGNPVADATVAISNSVALTDAGGAFSLILSNAVAPCLLTVTKTGFAPASRLLTDEAPAENFTLYKPENFIVQSPTNDISITNSKGLELFIPANSLSRADGLPIVSPLRVSISTVDPCDSKLESPTSFNANGAGGLAFFSSLSMAHIALQDASRSALTLSGGTVATMGLPVSAACVANFTNLPDSAGIWWYDLGSGTWNSGGSGVLRQSPVGSPPVYTVTASAVLLNNYTAVDPSGPYSTLTLTADRTLALPFDMRIVGPSFSYTRTFFASPTTLIVPPSVVIDISVLNHREAPGAYFSDQTNSLTAATPDTSKTVILKSTVTTPPAYAALLVPLKLGNQVPLLSTKVEVAEPFLTHNFTAGSAATAASYYAAIDPANQKTTLAAWMSVNGFGSGDDATAAYFNASDLGFGRRMHMKRVGNDVAFYVSNFDTVQHAAMNIGPFATVAMDYTVDPAHSSLGRYTKFYVFDAAGNRVDRANLDGGGDKFVPNLCQICHGGTHPVNPANSNAVTGFNLSAKFVPFDMDSYTYSTLLAWKPSAQHNALRTMNVTIRDYTAPTTAIQDLVNGWYGVSGTGTFNKNYVPTAWQGVSDLPVYRDAVKVSCRACHITRSFDFSSPTTVGYCANNVCNLLVMPDAQRTFSILWGSKTANVGGTGTPPNQQSILSTRYGSGWSPCP